MIEKPNHQASIDYYFTRLEGQLVRLNILAGHSTMPSQIRAALADTQKYLGSLKDVVNGKTFDVT